MVSIEIVKIMVHYQTQRRTFELLECGWHFVNAPYLLCLTLFLSYFILFLLYRFFLR
jgi:hypothetical protein